MILEASHVFFILIFVIVCHCKRVWREYRRLLFLLILITIVICRSFFNLGETVVEIEEEEEEEGDELQETGSPLFTEELKPVSAMEGEEIYLSAVVTAQPQPQEVTWKHNGVILQPHTTDALIYYLPDKGICELTISEAFMEDAGIYEVEAQNAFGIAISQTEVHVNDSGPSEAPVSVEQSKFEATVSTSVEAGSLSTDEEVEFEENKPTTVLSKELHQVTPTEVTVEIKEDKSHQLEQIEAEEPLQKSKEEKEVAPMIEIKPTAEVEIPKDVVDAAITPISIVGDLHTVSNLELGEDVTLSFEVTPAEDVSVTWFKVI